jgi:hypothetical protein
MSRLAECPVIFPDCPIAIARQLDVSYASSSGRKIRQHREAREIELCPYVRVTDCGHNYAIAGQLHLSGPPPDHPASKNGKLE